MRSRNARCDRTPTARVITVGVLRVGSSPPLSGAFAERRQEVFPVVVRIGPFLTAWATFHHVYSSVGTGAIQYYLQLSVISNAVNGKQLLGAYEGKILESCILGIEKRNQQASAHRAKERIGGEFRLYFIASLGKKAD
jgi:hypothetical protein